MIGITSCKQENVDNEKKEYQALYDEVIKIHDDVMPETNNLYKLKKFAQENLDILSDTSKFVEPLLAIQVKATKADDVMMEWMENFAVPNSNHEKKMEYLTLQKNEIEEVRKIILNTIYEGKKIIIASDQYIRENNLSDEERKTVFRPK